ncbi:MAG: hypothetical protein ABMA02_13405 [Saprospiraceae bacterium]
MRALENELQFPSILRRFLSIFNSVAMILFLSYFQEGWVWLNQKIKKLRAIPEMSGLAVLAVCIGAALVHKTFWLGAETAMSALVASLLATGFARSFWRRRHLRWMCLLAINVGLYHWITPRIPEKMYDTSDT